MAIAARRVINIFLSPSFHTTTKAHSIVMPVTEFATLKLKEPYTTNNEDLRKLFQSVAKQQATWSGYPLTFYHNAQNPSLLHIVSGWKNAHAHQKWIASEENQKYLSVFDPLLSVEGLAHVDVDFAQVPSNTQVLVFRKRASDDEETKPANGTTIGRQPAWAGEGVDVDNPKDFYYFAAYDNFDESTRAVDDGSILRRVYF
ncbi:hypothetical protein CPB84DRAFT_1761584 [Gymnopilus junonius]|uniref:ABM domain-containing protein n=1 Tax=Gymnopilus junonius TaxID=109634 RepID=A0A9P5P297_GYMJU|nr:hypothetical protein CPB84DRAFT_1761584 [Gymnopilus junonius]